MRSGTVCGGTLGSRRKNSKPARFAVFLFFKTFLLLFPAYLDRTAILQYDKARNQNHPKYYFLSFDEIHISQAQVSRLEKGALEHIRKQI